MRVLGIETTCDETAAAVVGTGYRRARRDPLQRGAEPDRRACRLWRRGAGDRRPRACGGDRPPRRAGARRTPACTIDEIDGIAAAAGPGPDRRRARRAHHRQGAGAGDPQAAPRRQPPRGACADGAADRRDRLPVSPPPRLGRAHAARGGARRRRLRAPRHDDRRRDRRGLRQGREAARPRLSGRPAGRAGGAEAATRSASRCRGRCTAGPSRTSPSPGSRPRCGSRPSASRRSAPRDVADLCASFQAAIVDVVVDRTRVGLRAFREAAGHPTALVVAGGVAANQAIRSALAAVRGGIGPQARGAAARAVRRQRRHDRLGGARAPAARPRRRPDGARPGPLAPRHEPRRGRRQGLCHDDSASRARAPGARRSPTWRPAAGATSSSGCAIPPRRPRSRRSAGTRAPSRASRSTTAGPADRRPGGSRRRRRRAPRHPGPDDAGGGRPAGGGPAGRDRPWCSAPRAWSAARTSSSATWSGRCGPARRSRPCRARASRATSRAGADRRDPGLRAIRRLRGPAGAPALGRGLPGLPPHRPARRRDRRRREERAGDRAAAPWRAAVSARAPRRRSSPAASRSSCASRSRTGPSPTP